MNSLKIIEINKNHRCVFCDDFTECEFGIVDEKNIFNGGICCYGGKNNIGSSLTNCIGVS